MNLFFLAKLKRDIIIKDFNKTFKRKKDNNL